MNKKETAIEKIYTEFPGWKGYSKIDKNVWLVDSFNITDVDIDEVSKIVKIPYHIPFDANDGNLENIPSTMEQHDIIIKNANLRCDARMCIVRFTYGKTLTIENSSIDMLVIDGRHKSIRIKNSNIKTLLIAMMDTKCEIIEISDSGIVEMRIESSPITHTLKRETDHTPHFICEKLIIDNTVIKDFYTGYCDDTISVKNPYYKSRRGFIIRQIDFRDSSVIIDSVVGSCIATPLGIYREY